MQSETHDGEAVKSELDRLYIVEMHLERPPTDDELDRIFASVCTDPEDETHDCIVLGGHGMPGCPECYEPLHRGHVCEPDGGWAPVVAVVDELRAVWPTLRGCVHEHDPECARCAWLKPLSDALATLPPPRAQSGGA